MTKAVIVFAVLLAVYFSGLGVFTLVKWLISKRKSEKEVIEYEARDENSVTKE